MTGVSEGSSAVLKTSFGAGMDTSIASRTGTNIPTNESVESSVCTDLTVGGGRVSIYTDAHLCINTGLGGGVGARANVSVKLSADEHAGMTASLSAAVNAGSNAGESAGVDAVFTVSVSADRMRPSARI